MGITSTQKAKIPPGRDGSTGRIHSDDPNLLPETHMKKLNGAAHACNRSEPGVQGSVKNQRLPQQNRRRETTSEHYPLTSWVYFGMHATENTYK